MMEAVGSAELHGLDMCGCDPCSGRSLTRLAYLIDHAAGRAHDVASLLEVGATLRAHTASDRADWWLRHRLTAWNAHHWLRRTSDVAVPLPKALTAWVRLGAGDVAVPVDQR